MRRWFSSLLSLHLWLGVVVLAWAGVGAAASPSGALAEVPALSQMAAEWVQAAVNPEPAAAQPGADLPSEWPELLQACVLTVDCVGQTCRPGMLIARAWVAPALDGPHRPPRHTHHV